MSWTRALSSNVRPPTMSSNVRKPIFPCLPASCSAMKKKKIDIHLWLAAELDAAARVLASATPRASVRWHLRIMMQPMEINGAVRRPNSFGAERSGDGDVAPLSFASVCRANAAAQIVHHQDLLRFASRELHAPPACLIELSGLAPGATGIARISGLRRRVRLWRHTPRPSPRRIPRPA